MNEIRTKSWWVGLTAEKIVGLVFVVAAAVKAWDLEAFAVQIRYYHLVTGPETLAAAAIGSVVWETLLGVAMLVALRLRGWTFAAVTATLAVFTGLIVYAWYFHDLADCGCFGSLAPLGPRATTAKNGVLLALTIIAWLGLRNGHTRIRCTLWQHPYLKASVVAASCVLVLVAGLLHKPFEETAANPGAVNGEKGPSLVFQGEYEGQTYDTSTGDYFIAFFSDTCPECQAETVLLNDYLYTREMPAVIAFMLTESEDTFEGFRNLAEFPIKEMQPGKWIHYIGEAPPRFYLVRDGKEITHWDDHLPPLETILAALDEGQPQARGL